MISAAVLTISDKGSKGEREDITGKDLKELLESSNYSVEYYKIIPDEIEEIKRELIYICDELKLNLILTNGGTGFSKRDVTPEATLSVIEKNAIGIAEAMRYNSLKITPKAMLSRAAAGIRKDTLIINLPGSPKGAVENFKSIMDAIPHGIDILTGKAKECAR
ncbi:molybdopterin adenylyltransferase [Caloramator quimbayensis]|uniref:Molybdopterin adenylyltransferase n=1 Tax=Caloramator quimbayensis TaxID=1147123 RepID=A0A1T4XZM4_9CLOT|nr:MogA/MoaB family molybdenum cofactor biosynthesis protein [Caloramator quimbayensis]SKA95012.1 molybdopterin adenylyltransferase [Caloramator quimbayensis]